MLDEIKKHAASIQLLVTLLIIAVSIYLFEIAWQILGNFSDIFIILISAWVLSFILEPFVERTKNLLTLSKVMAAFLVYILFFGLIVAIIFLFIPVVSNQIQNLIEILPRYLSTSPLFLRKWLDATVVYLSTSLPLISGVATFFVDLFLVIIISFYFVTDRETINKEMYNLTPKKWRAHVSFIQELVDTTFASYLRVQLLFGILSGIATWIVLRLFNVDYAASLALLSGILTIIPLVGPILAIVPPLLLPALTNTTQAIFIFIVLVLFQQIIFNVIGPKLLSRAFKLHPVVVLLSFLVGYKIAGGIGAIFAVPVLGIFVVVLHQISHHFLDQHQK